MIGTMQNAPAQSYNITIGDNSQVYIIYENGEKAGYNGENQNISVKTVNDTNNALKTRDNALESKDSEEIQEIINSVYNGKKADNMQLSVRYRKIGRYNLDDYYDKKGVRLENCSTYLAFAKIEGKYKMVKTNLCRVRLCPMCAYKRSLAVYRNTRQIYDYLLENEPHSKFLFITLTIRNVDRARLKSALDALNKGFQNIVRQKAFKKIALGTLRTIEITYNKNTGMYHPHIHVLLHTSTELYAGRNYITQEKLSQMWASAAGITEYIPVVDIRAFKANTKRELAEVAKYSVKPSDYLNTPDSVLITLDDILHKRHLLSLSGSFKRAKAALKIKDMEEKEEYNNSFDDLEAELIIYKWHFGQDKYILDNSEKLSTVGGLLSSIQHRS